MASNSHKLKVFPNPVNNKEEIQAAFYLKKSKRMDIKILDLTGSVVQAYRMQKFKKGEHQIKLGHSLQSGMYLLTFQFDQEKITRKILIAP